MIDKQVMSSDKDNWETPDWLYDRIDNIFQFSLDAAADCSNAKHHLYINPTQNSLTTNWLQYIHDYWEGDIDRIQNINVWLNPPYGKVLPLQFLRKVKHEYEHGLDIVVLTAARTDTKFFKIIWDNAWKVLFFYGRLKFELDGQMLATAPFPSALAVFSHHHYDLSSLENLGKIVTLKELN